MNLNPGRSGRKRSALTPANLQMLEDLIDGKINSNISNIFLKKINISVESDLPARVSRSSCRKNRLPVTMSKSSFNRGIKEIGYHPYKLIYQ